MVIAAGVGGGVTGFGADVLLIDDPVKNREDADSETMREKAWQWYLDVARTRLMPNGAIVLQMTRWHEDDMAGRVLNSPGASEWTVLNLPALAEAGDTLGRDIGQPLWPDWYDEQALADLKRDLGTRSWLALYQQRPTAEEGGMFKRSWFTDRYETAPKMQTIIQTVDSAFKTGVANDYSSIATWGTDGVNYYVLDVWRDKVEFPQLMTAVQDNYAKQATKPHALLIEDTASGQSVIQQLRSTTKLPVIPVRVSASKEARAGSVAPLAEALKVKLPKYAPWVDEWIEEHVSFPTGKHDDLVDTTSMALARLSMGGGKLPKAQAVAMTAGRRR